MPHQSHIQNLCENNNLFDTSSSVWILSLHISSNALLFKYQLPEAFYIPLGF